MVDELMFGLTFNKLIICAPTVAISVCIDVLSLSLYVIAHTSIFRDIAYAFVLTYMHERDVCICIYVECKVSHFPYPRFMLFLCPVSISVLHRVFT